MAQNRVGQIYVGYKSVYGNQGDRPYDFADHYYYATDAKFGGPGLPFEWRDTGDTGGVNLPYIGTQAVFVTINSASGSYIETTNNAAYYDASAITTPSQADFSFRMWLRHNTDTSSGVRYFLEYGAGASDDIITVYQERIGGAEHLTVNVAGTGPINITEDFFANTWTMWTFTYDGSTDVGSWYKNDTLVGSETLGESTPQFGPELRLLDGQAGSGNNWNQDTKLFAWYKQKLTPELVEVLYNKDLESKF